MTEVNERLVIRCPYARARQYLHEALQPASNSPLPHMLRLTANVPLTGVELAKSVRVQYGHAEDPMHFDEVFQIKWTPEAGGIYPSFAGELRVCADETYERAILQLTGEYEPPLGAAGRAFDAAIGRRLAADTAHNLLSEIAGQMEARYNREEAAKKDIAIP